MSEDPQSQPLIQIINQNAQSAGTSVSRRHGFLWWFLIGWWYAPIAACYGRGWLWGRNRASRSGASNRIR